MGLTGQITLLAVAAGLGGAAAMAVRLGIISDLQTDHVGRHEREAVDRLLALHPDVILVAGDLFQGSFDAYQRTQRPMQELLARLEAPGGVFFVRGDVDPLTGPIAVLAGTDITLLDDEVAMTEVGDRRLHIGGTMLDWQTPAARRVYRDLEAVPDDDIAILLAHRPDAVLDLPVESRVDLTVAGHYGICAAIPGRWGGTPVGGGGPGSGHRRWVRSARWAAATG